MPNNALDIRQMLGFLGSSPGPSGGMVVGERRTFATIIGPNAVAASTAARFVLNAPVENIPLLPSEALAVEYMSGAIQPTDGSGKLQFQGGTATIFDNGAPNQVVAVMNVIFPTINTLLPTAASNLGLGFFIEPPPLLRPRDLKRLQGGGNGTPSVPPYFFQIEVDLLNTDGAAPHSANIYATGAWRVISGVTP